MSVRIFNWVNGQEVEVLPDKDRRRRVMNGPRPNFRNDGSTISIKLAEEAIASLIRTGLQSADQSNADELGESDPDNEGAPDRQKEHQSIKETRKASVMTAAETFKQKAELQGKIAGFLEQGNFAAARECEKVFNVYLRHEEAANEPTEEQQRQSLVDSIVRNGKRLMGR
jgi:hypothetical protein